MSSFTVLTRKIDGCVALTRGVAVVPSGLSSVQVRGGSEAETQRMCAKVLELSTTLVEAALLAKSRPRGNKVEGATSQSTAAKMFLIFSLVAI
jgi:hypothetical protein